ncbi:MAG TPA: hypothetical protein VEH82_09635, partial [Acidimicrobiales bacterium]|nr:hypothetical protein [Acidimicrobiales bacterium]
TLYGLSVADQLEVATPAPPTTTVPSSLAIQPVTGNFSTPTPVSAVLTNPSTGQPIANEPVTFTLNGSETCTATTDSTGTATCDITAGEPSSTYTLTASFSGDTSTSAPIGSDTSSSTFTVNPDTSTLTYTGPTTAVNGQSITLSGTLTTSSPTSGTPLPTKVVTFTIGSGSTAQSCSAVTDANGDVSCTIAVVNQPTTDVTITSSFAGDSYDTAATVTTPATVTEPTTLTVSTGTSPYSNAVTVSAVLKDANTNAPISGESVTLQLNGSETCTATTDATGTASCTITPEEPSGTYTLTATFAGDTTLPLQLTGSSGSVNFVVTPEGTTLTYTGGTTAQNGQSLTVSGVLTTTNGTAVPGVPVTFTLGSGTTAQTCTGTTGSTGAVSCVINVTGQPQGPIPVSDSFGGNQYFQSTSASSTVNLPEGTTLTVTSVTGDYATPTTVSATLINVYTNAPVPNEPVTFTFNGTQTCTATTNASGVASCTITPTAVPGTYSLTASFGGDTTTTPVLLSSSGSSTLVEAKDSPTITYTGSTTTTSGQAPNLSATLVSDTGAPMSGQTVTFTVGSGKSAQSCTATTNSAGVATCHICMYNQTASPLPVIVTYGGNTYYGSVSTSKTVTVVTPTTLMVNAATGTYGQSLTLSGTLVNSVSGADIAGQSVTLTLNGAQSCTATTNGSGQATCTVTPSETTGTYPVTGSFGGAAATGTSPQLLSAKGSNTVVITGAPTTITYTGATTATNGQSLTVSATLASGSTLPSGQQLTFTLGTGKSAQSCTATTVNGAASCTISSVNQVAGTLTVTVTYGGNTTYAASSTTAGVKIPCSGGGGGGSGGGPCGGGSSGGGCGGVSEPPPVGGGRACG